MNALLEIVIYKQSITLIEPPICPSKKPLFQDLQPHWLGILGTNERRPVFYPIGVAIVLRVNNLGDVAEVPKKVSHQHIYHGLVYGGLQIHIDKSNKVYNEQSKSKTDVNTLKTDFRGDRHQ